eukprot:c12452_g1_i2 orf=549-1724(-)
MASLILPGLASLPRSRCCCNSFPLFMTSGAAASPLYGMRLQTSIATNTTGWRMHISKNVCVFASNTPFATFSEPNMSSARTTPASNANTPPATTTQGEKPMTTLPPIVDEEDPNPIIPPSVEFPQPIELPPHRIDKPVTMVAGASRGLGLEFTRQILAKYSEGPVIATCRNPDSAENLLALKDQYPSRLTVMKLDVTDEMTVKVVAREIYDKYGRLDLYVNTVGVLHIPDVMTPERKIDQFNRDSAMLAFKINAVGPAIVAKHMLPLLKFGQGEGTGRGGAVLAHLSAKVGSIYDNRLGGWYSYRASKAGLNQLTRTIGVECLRLKLPVITILLHPGTVDTDLSKPFSRNVSPEHLFTPAASVEKLLDVIDSLKPEDCAKFLNYDRQELPW